MNPLAVGSSCAPNQFYVSPPTIRAIYLTLLCCSIFFHHSCLAKTICVDQNAKFKGKATGSCWTKPFLDLEDALASARKDKTIDEIWIASGVYKPSKTYSPKNLKGKEVLAGAMADPKFNPGITATKMVFNYAENKKAFNNRLKTFNLVDNLSLRGGFLGKAHPSGGEKSLDERIDTTLPTILDGDLQNNDLPEDHVWHVVVAGNDLSYQGVNVVLDNLTIRNGYSVDAPYFPMNFPLYDDQQPRHYHDDGAGLYIFALSNIKLIHVNFENNHAISGGAIFVQDGSKLVLDHCTFSNNTARQGNAISARGGGPNTRSDPKSQTTVLLINPKFEGPTLKGKLLFASDNYAKWLTKPRATIELKPKQGLISMLNPKVESSQDENYPFKSD